MRTHKMSDMVNGWFVGDFSPAVLQTNVCEAAVKQYVAGDQEARHHHKVAVEITLIAEGQVLMNGQTYTKGDIIVIEPGESTDFQALRDTITVVVKLPSVKGDKYSGEASDA